MKKIYDIGIEQRLDRLATITTRTYNLEDAAFIDFCKRLSVLQVPTAWLTQPQASLDELQQEYGPKDGSTMHHLRNIHTAKLEDAWHIYTKQERHWRKDKKKGDPASQRLLTLHS